MGGQGRSPAPWIPQGDGVLQLGDFGTAVRLLHAVLQLVNPDLNHVDLGGDRYTEATVDAVRWFQGSVRLEPTGVLDEPTGRCSGR
jgi:Putative peptidoglycan binding domain